MACELIGLQKQKRVTGRVTRHLVIFYKENPHHPNPAPADKYWHLWEYANPKDLPHAVHWAKSQAPDEYYTFAIIKPSGESSRALLKPYMDRLPELEAWYKAQGHPISFPLSEASHAV